MQKKLTEQIKSVTREINLQISLPFFLVEHNRDRPQRKKEKNSICLKKQQPFSLPRFSFHFNIAFPPPLSPPLFHLILIFLQSSSTRPSSAGERGIRGEEPQDTAKGKRALRILQLTVSSRPTHLHRLCERRMAYQDLQPLAPA